VLVVVGDIAENPSFLRSKPIFEVGVLYLTMVVNLGWANVTILTLYESLLYHCFIIFGFNEHRFVMGKDNLVCIINAVIKVHLAFRGKV
jgi:hypothetical protein